MTEIRTNDTGVTISVSLDEDVSSATLLQLVLQSPYKENKAVTASLSGASNYIVEYDTQAGVFDVAGNWKAQVRVVDATRDRRSSMFFIDVGEGF